MLEADPHDGLVAYKCDFSGRSASGRVLRWETLASARKLRRGMNLLHLLTLYDAYEYGTV